MLGYKIVVWGENVGVNGGRGLRVRKRPEGFVNGRRGVVQGAG